MIRFSVWGSTLSVCLVLCFPGVASAQRASELHQGAKVRLVDSSGHTRVGTLAGYSSDSLTLLDPRWNGRPTTIAFSDAAQIDVSTGISVAEGAVRGAFIGLVVGGVGGWAASRISSGHDQVAEFVLTVGGGLGGTALGATVGAFTGVERWKTLTPSKP